jgi:imidazolonepropionase-like amidohydrolase
MLGAVRFVRSLPLLALLAACAEAPTPVAPTPPPAEPSSPPPALPAPAPSPITVKRLFVSLSRPSGTLVSTTSPDGTVSVVYDVLENGRGPHVEATIRLSADGTIAALDAKGHHEMGTPVEESFRREGPRARWKSKEEQGDEEAPANAFFLPMAPLPDVAGLLAAAILKAGGALPLLPAGEARIEEIGEHTLKKGAEARHVTGYAVHGPDLLPVYVWMNDDGSWFGSVDAWSSTVPEGWEGSVAPLVALQDAADRRHDAAVVAKIAHRPPPAGLALVHARVLDVARGRWVPDQTVIVAGDTIQSVSPSKGAKVPPGAEVVDLAGKALLPGLWDMHVHLSSADGVLNVASGVTSVRDVGNDPDKLDDYKKRFDEGLAVGPHTYRMGFVEGRGEKAASSTVTAETPDEARAAVELFARRGYDGMKIYNSVKRELIPIIAKEAHARGMKVTGHIPVHVLAAEAVEDGYDGIEHLNMLFLNFLATHETDTRDTTRFTLVGEKAGSLDLASKPVTGFFALLKKKHTVIDPTMNVFEDLLLGRQGRVLPGLEAMVARLPLQVARGFLDAGMLHEGKEELYQRSFDKCLAMIRALAEAKVTLVAGTDSLAGLMLHRELALFVQAGIAPADALRMATLTPARVLGKDKVSGSIDKGKVADLVIVDGDPLARIADLGKVVTTLKSGVLYDAAALYATVGVRSP